MRRGKESEAEGDVRRGRVNDDDDGFSGLSVLLLVCWCVLVF